MFKDSKFIVMDEPTSALDAASEKMFFEEFKYIHVLFCEYVKPHVPYTLPLGNL